MKKYKYIPNQLQLNKQKSKPCCKVVQCMYKLRGNLYDFCHTCAQQWFCQWANRQSYPVWIFLIFCQKDFLQMPDFWSFSNLVHISTGYIRFYLNHQIIGLLQDAEDREMHVEQSKRMLLLKCYLVTFKVLVYIL